MSSTTTRPLVFTTPYSPIAEARHEDDDVAAGNGCFGFCVPGSGTKTKWAATQFKKMKEFSEIVAGPKWKNFIRKIGKLCNPRKNNNETVLQLFHYSPESYELNFAGDGNKEEDDQTLLHSFSSRFANHADFANISNNVRDRTG